MGNNTYTYFGIFKADEKEKEKLIAFLGDETDALQGELYYGIGSSCKWLVTIPNDNPYQLKVNNPVQALSAKFPNLTFVFVCVGQEKKFNYVVGNNGKIMVFDFKETVEETAQLQAIVDQYGEDHAIDHDIEWDEELQYSKTLEWEKSVLKRKMRELGVEDLSGLLTET
jgi:hypothetical protein